MCGYLNFSKANKTTYLHQHKTIYYFNYKDHMIETTYIPKKAIFKWPDRCTIIIYAL